MPTFKRVIVGLAAIVLVLGVLVAAMFAFGTPVASQVPPQPAAPAGGPVDAAEAVSPASTSGPLAIEVPGCVCHSDDPQVVAEHATYRMSQCFDCHRGGTPQMGGTER